MAKNNKGRGGNAHQRAMRRIIKTNEQISQVHEKPAADKITKPTTVVPPTAEKYNASDKLAIALACLTGIIAIALFLVEKTPVTIVSLLLITVALVIYPVIHFFRHGYRLIAMLIFLAATLFVGRNEWPKSSAADVPRGALQPKFDLSFMSLMTSTDNVTGKQRLTVLAKITNSGVPGAASAETWQLQAKIGDAIHNGMAVQIGPDNPIDECKPGTGKAYRFVAEDSLAEKASHSIATYDYQQGILIFSFPDVTDEEMNRNSTVLNLAVQDVSGHKFFKEESIAALSMQPKNGFITGMKNPYPVESENCKNR
jgi:hypothetical protein